MNFCSVRFFKKLLKFSLVITVFLFSVAGFSQEEISDGPSDLDVLSAFQDAQDHYKKSVIKYIDLHFELKGKLDAMIASEGLEAVLEKVNLKDDSVGMITRDGIGSVEATIVDGHLAYKVKPMDANNKPIPNNNFLSFRKKGSQLAFVFVDEAHVERTSKHLLDLYIPRQHIAAGTERPDKICLLYTSPSPRDATLSRMPSSA